MSPREKPDSNVPRPLVRRTSERAERARERVEAEGGVWVDGAFSWAPFKKDNVAAKRHGALAKAVHLEPAVRELVEGVLADRPDLEAYPEALCDWADAEVRSWMLRSWLSEHSMFTERGTIRDNVLKHLAVFSRRSEAGRIRLGLDPPSAAQLMSANVDASVSLDDLRRRGRAALDANAGIGDGESAPSSGWAPEFGEPGRGGAQHREDDDGE